MRSGPQTLQSTKDNAMTRRGMHFAVVADKLDLFSTYERAAEIEPIVYQKDAGKRKL